jgi:hypothetical protein
MIRMLEISWLLLTLVALALGTYKLIADGFSEAVFYIIVMGVSFSMYLIRRKQRVRMNKEAGM